MSSLKTGVLAEPVLVGRERELEELQHSLKLAGEGKGTTVFISGEAGSGKTRLVAEFLDLAKKDAVVLAGWCLSNAAQPLFPFVEAFESYYSTADSDLAQQQGLKSWLVGNTQAEGREVTPQVWKDQTFAAISKELLSMSIGKPIILFIDDIHWADSASLALLHYVSRSAVTERLLVVAALRTEEIRTRLRGQLHPLAETLRLMAREDLFKEIKLRDLSHTDIRQIAENMLGGSVDPEIIEELSTESHGNPLFVVEALRMMYSQRSVQLENGKWHLTNRSVGIPPKVRDVIIRRLETLRPSQRKILDVASVIGESFDPKIVAFVCSQDSIDTLRSLKSVAESTLLIINEGDNYRFKHAKIQEMLYREIPPLLKKELHSRIAAMLEAQNQCSEEPHLSNVAYHYIHAEQKDKAIKYSLAAGQDALAKWSNVQAIEHFKYTIMNASEQQTLEKRTALEGLGDAYAANCMYDEAIRTFDKLAASETGVTRLRALRKAMDAAFVKGDKPDLLLDYAEKSKMLAVCDRLEMARVLMNRGRAFAWAGRGNVSQDLADYQAALQVFEEEYSLPDIAEALARDGEARGIAEDMLEKGLGELLRSAAIFRELGDFRREIQAALRTAYGFVICGLLDEAKKELFKVLREGERLGIFVELARARGILSSIAEAEVDFSKAISEASKSIEYNEKADIRHIEGLNLGLLTRVYCRLGNLKLADEYFEKMKKLSPEILSTGILGLYVPVTEAVHFAAHGHWEESNRIFEKLEQLGWEWPEESYAWALEKQGRIEKAKALRLKAQKIREEVQARFEQANLQMSLLMPRIINVGEQAEIRVDLVNVARNPGTLVRFERLIPPDCTIVSIPPFCLAQNDSVLFARKSIGPFQVETIKLSVTFSKTNTYHINPSIVYLDDSGKTITRITRPIIVKAQLRTVEQKEETFNAISLSKLDFESQSAERAFNFLVSAFKEDYISRRLPKENCGWRTLMEIVKNSTVTTYSIYGRSGRDGKAKLELEHLRVAESRYFQGERGRGGRILKMRILLENQLVRLCVGIPKD